MPRFPRTRRWLEQLLHTHDTPRRTAAAFALGVFLGFSPLLGLHTILALIFAFAFGLNRVAVLLGVYSNLPWILPAYYSLTTVAGAAIVGADVPPGVVSDLSSALRQARWGEFRDLVSTLAPLLRAFVVGSTLGAAVLAAAGYRLSLAMILAHRRRVALHRQQNTDGQ
jgi:uncharacterized protein (DUF2062 family)